MGAYADFYIDSGADFTTSLDLESDDGVAINAANYSFEGTMKTSYYSNTIAANLSFSNANAALGIITMYMNAATSYNISPGRYLYDVVMTDTSNVKSRLLEGIITVTPRVT